MERHYLVSSLEFRKKLKNVSDSEYKRLREAYDDFLEQPLKLEMFVPLDDKGRICHEVIINNEDDLDSERFKKYYETENKEFENACLKMLFEPNFKVKYSDGDTLIWLDTTLVIGQLQEKQDKFILSRFRNGETIEDLIGFVKLKLSQTALDSIFGKTVA